MSTKQLVDRGLVLRAEITAREVELAKIEEDLTAAALAHSADHIELKDADREGRQWLAAGSAQVVPVIFTADKIIGSFKDGSAVHQTIRTALVGKWSLTAFYKPETTWNSVAKDGKSFRSIAQAMLGDRAPAFIAACIARDKHGMPKSDIKINWDDAEVKP